jgi:hypothetical protein
MRGATAIGLTVLAALWLSLAVTEDHDRIQFLAAGVFALIAAVLLTWGEDA